MTRYIDFLKSPLVLLLLVGSMAIAQQKHEKPNIVIILADDLGWGDVGFHGSEIKTPNLDEFAREGVVLSHFYTAPICSPTRAGLLTGRYPNRFGLRETVVPPWSSFVVDLDEKLLPEYLADNGYENRAILGKWHLGHAQKSFLPLSRGFTHFYGHYNGAIDYFTHLREGELDWHDDWETSHDKGYSTDLISDEAVNCIEKYAKDSPFFLYVAFNAPHGPLQAKKEDLLEYGFDEGKPLFSDATEGYGGQGKGNTRRQTYSAMVSNMDRGIGRILLAIKEAGIEDNTLVLFFSDNGAAPGEGSSSGALRGTKFTEWEGGVRSPAIIRWPQGFKGKRTVDQVMGYIDVLPTVVNAGSAGLEAPKKLDGINMLPVLQGKEDKIARDMYLGYGSMVNNTWKLVKAHSGNPRIKIDKDILFEIMKDPSEKENVRSDNKKAYREMMERISIYDSIKPEKSVPSYDSGRKGFKAPKDWVIED